MLRRSTCYGHALAAIKRAFITLRATRAGEDADYLLVDDAGGASIVIYGIAGIEIVTSFQYAWSFFSEL